MLEIFLAIVESARGRAAFVAIAVDIYDVLHRRKTDPAFLEKSDAILAQIKAAQTDDEKNAAHDAFGVLLNS